MVGLHCRCWQCDRCQPRRKRQLMAGVADGKPNFLLTLTSVLDSAPTPAEGARKLRQAWCKLRRWFRAENQRPLVPGSVPLHGAPEDGWPIGPAGYADHAIRYPGDKLPYHDVFEATVNGWPHLHIAMRVEYLDIKWVSRLMAKLLGAPIVNYRKFDNPGRLAGYLAKYVGKQPHRFEGCKRYHFSTNYKLTKWRREAFCEGVPGAWRLSRASLATLTAYHERHGWKARMVQAQVVLLERPP